MFSLKTGGQYFAINLIYGLLQHKKHTFYLMLLKNAFNALKECVIKEQVFRVKGIL